ncbi:MAG: hypothetical protein CO039_00350 [Candidatus Pacebacteria bacterium CG_4_9_14_0_2_um_filter_34_50]|nr:MAG: hypothetical protein CO039_00350 [Candidatus Pacebacteria bacterium CG_4_9_14_0_2_um_filter_34_50]
MIIMKTKEVSDLRSRYPFMGEVLRMIERGEKIDANSPYYNTYLMARQRGFVERVGFRKDKIVVSAKGKDFQGR